VNSPLQPLYVISMSAVLCWWA